MKLLIAITKLIVRTAIVYFPCSIICSSFNPFDWYLGCKITGIIVWLFLIEDI
jgi:hypothetical protein